MSSLRAGSSRPESRRLAVCPCRGPEDALVAAWFGLRFATAGLSTLEGATVRVLSAGVRNAGAGPDFLGAVVLIGEREVRGEVELHTHPAEWVRHGHDRDPRYDTIVLHVSLLPGPEIVTSSGRRVPRLVVSPIGPPPSARLRVPVVAAEAGIGPCHAFPAAQILRALDRLGVLRLERRAARFAAWAAADGPDEAVWRALAEVMGYGANLQAMRALAVHVPWRLFARIPAGPARSLAVEATLLQASGLWPREPRDPDARARLHTLAAARPPATPVPFRPAAWSAAVRPPDSPPRRFAALASLASRAPSPAAFLADALRDLRRIDRALLTPADPFWTRRAAWGPPTLRPQSLLGPGRARIAAASALLPLALALHPHLAPAARAAFLALPPLPEDHVTRFVRWRVFAHPAGRSLSAARQQGLHHLYRAGCALGRPGCPRCPLLADLSPRPPTEYNLPP